MLVAKCVFHLFLRVGGASSLKGVECPDPGYLHALRGLVEEEGANPSPIAREKVAEALALPMLVLLDLRLLLGDVPDDAVFVVIPSEPTETALSSSSERTWYWLWWRWW